MQKAAFLDRDGVINQKAPEGEYVTHWGEMHILPGVEEGISLLKDAGFRVIIITNQRCIAKGIVSLEEVERLHGRMRDVLSSCGAVIDAIYCCPHDGSRRCSCRKPAPGMLLTAAQDHSLDLNASWMIGDSDVDVEAGKAAGCKTALIENSQGFSSAETYQESDSRPDIKAKSLLGAARRIVNSSVGTTEASHGH